MTPLKIAATFAALLLVAACSTANAEDTTAKTTTPTYGPGWRHAQMMQARGQGPWGPAMMVQGTPGAGYGYGMGRGGPPLKADGTIDTTKLPDWCPMKTTVQQPQ